MSLQEDFSSIKTIKDEFEYWSKLGNRYDLKPEVADRAAHFGEQFKNINIHFSELNNKSFSEALDILEAVQDSLDNVWKAVQFSIYPESRMKNIFSIVGSTLSSFIENKLQTINIWKEDVSEVRESLRKALGISEMWIQVMDTLTSRFWSGWDRHPWTSGKYDDNFTKQLANRLDQILNLRSVHDQLVRLLSTEEKQELGMDKVFQSFISIKPFDLSSSSEINWQSALKIFESSIAPVEHRVAGKLRLLFSGLGEQTYQLLREFHKFKELISRPTINKELSSEREVLLAQLQTYLTNIKDDFENRSKQLPSTSKVEDDSPLMGRNLPEVVNNIVWVKQIISRVEHMSATSQAILQDLQRTSQFVSSSTNFLEDLRNYLKEQYNSWMDDMEASLRDPDSSLVLQMTGRMMSLDLSSGQLQVNYSERLVTLLREVRQLTALGFKIPRNVRNASDAAAKFYRHGIILKQVANFYNSFSQQIIPSQKLMLLRASVNFETVVKNTNPDGKGVVSWSTQNQAEAFIEKLQQAAERLVSENRKLRKYHFMIADKVVQLMSVDLIRHQDKWKDIAKEMRSMIDSLEVQGFENTKSWRLHWDYQLYKSLEFQYKLGLESLNENSPEINVELTYKQQQLQFKPPFEEIRAKYYSVMKKFIKFPTTFTGVGSNDIFKKMGERNAASLVTVYKKAEDLFKRVQEEKDQFNDWVALGSVDLEKYILENLHDVADYEANFKSIKVKGREMEKLPIEKKIDCINISFGPVRTTIEDLMQKFTDALISALRKEIQQQCSEVEKFINSAVDVLSKPPQTVEEIGLVTAESKRLLEAKPQVKSMLEKAEAKNKLLRSVAGGGVNIASVQNSWDNMEITMEYHEVMIKDRLESMKSDVETRVLTFNSELGKFAGRWNEIKPQKVAVQDRDTALAILNLMKEIKIEFSELKETANKISSDANTFSMSAPQFVGLENVEEEIKRYEESWNLYDLFTTEVKKIGEENWVSFRNKLYQFEEFVNTWYEKVKGLGKDSVGLYLRTEIEKFREIQPLLKFVRGDVLTPDHWAELYRILGMPKMNSTELTLGSFLGVAENLLKNANQVKELNARAQGEITIRDALRDLKAWGAECIFSLVDHEENGRVTPLIKDWKELMTAVGDNQSLLSSLKDSPYYKIFQDETSVWEYKLTVLDEGLHKLNNTQRRWVYLEPIFSRGALPQEQARFNKVDSEFRSIMAHISSEKRVISLVDYANIREVLIMLLDQLERCQKALTEYLEEKRAAFPRFYFLGDDDLLEILGQAQNPLVIQSHLKKLFQGIHTVEFSDNKKQIIAMRSAAGELVKFHSPVAISDKVEDWLSRLAAEMRNTLKNLLFQCVEVNDIVAFPSQILCTAEMIHFTQRCELAIQKGGLKQLHKELQETLAKYTSFDTADGITRLKLKALVLDIIHNMDVVEQLMKENVNSLNSWSWQKQLRFYLDERRNCKMRMSDAEFDYTYEYQGNSPKLVHTPLTDKCYLTLTQAMLHGFGGNPYGPAGTGKTESVKALGQAFARQVLVFNCDEGIDFKSMGRIFTGIVKCGAWGCFDEFNRLDEEVLSAVSQQIQIIQTSLKTKEKSVILLGNTIDVDFNAGIFVTLNPAGKGYGGRSKLPDNLKQLFRGVAMAIPDLEQIAEVILYSEGFMTAKELGSKLVCVFNLSKQLLTPQQHYDWGLRALKTILGTGGQLLQFEKKIKKSIDGESESKILVQALRINTLSKLTFDDTKRFNALVEDVFPNLNIKDASAEELENEIKNSFAELKLDLLPNQVKKILQFNEGCNQRMGVVIVGPGGSGKSTLWKILQMAMSKIKKKIITYAINPKSIPRQQLLGYMDLDTREWFDGVLTGAARSVVKEPLDVKSWIICDGDIDPEWIESLNSVLDDNRLLTLPSGERIQFASNVNFIFETHSLKWASPATVSRMGMIFLADEDMDSNALIHSWTKQQSSDFQQKIVPFIDQYFSKGLEWILKDGSYAVETTKAGTVLNGLSQLKGISTKSEFTLGLIRGLGSNLDLEKRGNFAREVFTWTNENPIDRRRPLNCYYDVKAMAYRSYDGDVVMNVSQEELIKEPVVPTVDVRSNADIIIPWIRNGDPFIIVGPEGCGKNMTLRHCFQQVPGTSVATLHCSSQTNSQHVIQKLNQHCGIFSSVKGRVYRPKEGERLVLYLKDLNLPKPDKYETIQLIAFLQQLITYGGFYDEKLEWLGLEKVQIVASMNPPTTTGRHVLTTRFTALMRLLVINYPAREQLQSIYSIYVDAALIPLNQHSQWRQKQNRQKLVNTMVEVYDQVKSKFTVDDFAHYQFTPRDITKWIVGLLRYDLQNSDLLEIWMYECDRHFKDRLSDLSSKQRFEKIVEAIVRTQWNISVNLKDFYFTSFLSDKKDVKILKKIPSNSLKEMIERSLLLYEREYKELNLQLFPEVIEHIARLDRILSSPGGSILLVGKSGVGRRSSVTLASFLSNIQIFSPNISKDYSLKNFKVDLKSVMQIAGVEGHQCVLLLEDHQFIFPEFMELMNSLLSSGEVPGLYSHEEIEPLLSPLKDKLSEQGYFGSLFGFFTKRIKDNLKIVISMDPGNDQFNSRCESNPALFTKCNIQWWNTWSTDTLKYVATNSLPKDIPNPDVVVKGILHIQEFAQSFGATPRQYINLLENYKNIYQTKRRASLDQQNRLQMGLGKLNEAASVVDQLSQDASVKKLKLAEKQEQANHALQEITKSMESASEQRKEMKTLEEKLEHEKIKMEDRKKEIESKLAGIQPKLDRAKELVGQIKPESLTEIKSFSTPPAAVAIVLSGVLTLMGNHDTSWNSMKRFLSERGVKDQILHFDAHLVSPESRAVVKKILDEKGASFEESAIQKTSKAAAPLAAWVKANVEYSEVLDSVMPLEENLAKLKKNLDNSEKRMKKLKDGLVEVDLKVNKLTNEFQGRTAEAAALKLELDKAEQMLDAAQMLLSKLGGEKGRWDQQVSDISKSLETLPANVLLAAGFITFLPSHPEDIRKQAIVDWTSFFGLSNNWNFKQFMSTESELLVLKGEGLPSDELSMENSVCILQGTNTPFIIDPTNIVSNWLKEHMKDKNVQFTTQEDARFSNTLELAIRFGKTLVVQEVDKIHPVLYPIIRKDKIRNGSRWQVQIGEKSVEYNDDFRIFLVTRNSSPIIPPDAFSLISTVNFTTTRSGLEGQLLGITIKCEKPELEKRKSQMLLEEEKQKVQLSALETQLLQELAASQGNILENKTLIESLNETKSKSIIIAQSLKEARELQESLDKERNVYKKIAVQGSLLFFLISDLQKINRMYQYSLGSFLKLFNNSLQKSDKDLSSSTAVEARINSVCEKLQKLVFEYVSRSIFKADRLMFGIHLVHTMYPKLFGENEWEIFTQKILAPIGGTSEFPSWATSDRKGSFSVLQNTIPRVIQALALKDLESWTPWSKSSVCELEFPTKYAKKVTAFQKILVIQALRPDRLESALSQFVCEVMQVNSLSPVALNLFKVYKDESSSSEPILLIVSPGADPSQELEELANKTVGKEKYLQVAMGQGQAEVALAYLRKAAVEGGWLCLKNLHLATSWMGTLEKELHSMNPHQDFRLWMTSEPHIRFSSILLKSSLKITFEAPPGLKKNLLRTFESWNSEYLSKGSVLRANALFVLAWFHAIIQERRTFIPQGWTKFYEFSFTDLRSSADIIDQVSYGTSNPTLEWNVVHGILENAIYGGRVDNDYDLRVLRGYLQYFFNNEMLGKQATRKITKSFNLPNSVQHEAYLDIINQLSDSDNPNLFFLPTNIDRSLQRANSQMVVSQLKILSTSVDANSKFNREKWAQELTPLIQLWQNLTSNNTSLNDPKMDNNPDLSPIDSFVSMETKKAHDLLKNVNSTIQSLVKVINGTQLLTPAITLVGASLLKGEVPSKWADSWEGALDPYLWLKGVVSRTIALDNWTERSRNQTLLTSPVDFGDLFRPETFINALRQQTARLIKCPVQQLKLIVSPEIRQMVRCKLPVTVTGLLLQGAGFEGGRLSEANSDSPTFTNIAQLVIGFVPQQEPDPYPMQNLIPTPLYYTSNKEKLLYEISLPCSNDKPKWIMTGVSLFVCE